jgi:uncharacterized protein (DUF362 family)/ferredoxin
MNFSFDMITCATSREIREGLYGVLHKYEDLLPAEKAGMILLKPNLNSNMNAFTGNTTDLRIISAVVRFFKDLGYTNIIIGEGTNSGFYRNGISVIKRLGIDRLARYFGIQVRDLNESDCCEIEFDQGVKAQVAKEVMDAQLLINMPKLKTHFENGMSVCLKNLMGSLVGQENKKKTHDNLPENILKINHYVKPHLHIVDALIAMEGLGPTKGVPVRMDKILVGKDPYFIDLVCAELADFDAEKVRTLALARKKRIIDTAYQKALSLLELEKHKKKFAPPKASPLANFIHSPGRQKFFLKIRNTSFFTYLASTDWFAKFLYVTDLRQDVFISEEMVCDALELDRDACSECNLCRDVCPLELELPKELEHTDFCINCMYCYSVCPENAIKFKGRLGFFQEQIKQYDRQIRRIYR